MSSSTPRPLDEGFTDNLDEIVRRVPLDVPLSLNVKGEVDENQNFLTKIPEKPDLIKIF